MHKGASVYDLTSLRAHPISFTNPALRSARAHQTELNILPPSSPDFGILSRAQESVCGLPVPSPSPRAQPGVSAWSEIISFLSPTRNGLRPRRSHQPVIIHIKLPPCELRQSEPNTRVEFYLCVSDRRSRKLVS